MNKKGLSALYLLLLLLTAAATGFNVRMNKIGLSGLKSFDQYKSLSGSGKTLSMASRPSMDLITSGNFANLKLTAEKLVKEQASVKTDLDMTNSKLKKSMEHIRTLEGKLQNAFNENAKHKVKQKEDEKLWKGLESKFSSTKTLCDQLTETLQHLAGQVQNAEKDKVFFEDKLAVSALAIDELNHQMNGLSLKLESAEASVRNREDELKELSIEKDKREESYRVEQSRTAKLMEEKDGMIKQLEASVAAKNIELESLNNKLTGVHLELRSKEDEIKLLRVSLEKLDIEKRDLQFSNEDFSNKLVASLHEIKALGDLVQLLTTKLIDLDKISLNLSENFAQLNSTYGSCFMLVQQERDLAAKHAQQQYDKINDKFLCITSEKDALELLNGKLSNKLTDLHRVQESLMVQHAEECGLAEERIRRLESKAEILVLKKTETEMLVSKLEEKIVNLSNNSSLSENKMQDLLLNISALETENKDTKERLQTEIEKKAEENDSLQKDIGKYEQQIDSMEKQISQLHITLEEKEQHILQCNDRDKQLEDQNAEIQALLTVAESRLSEAKKQYDLMLESKQLELSRHLKEISQKNDQAINDIRRKYEVEKLEIVNLEKEKADKVVGEMETKLDQKLAESKEELKQYVIRLQEEHTALVSRIQQEHDKKELSLKADHSEELKHVQLQAENELREKTTKLRNEHEVQVRALRRQHEDECREIQEELDLQKSKEERQRALLQLQWRVMSDKPQDDQEVNSKKDNSISSIKMTNLDGSRKGRRILQRAENEEKDSPFLRATQTPVSNMPKKVEAVNTGSVMSIPKHSRKVTHHDYEVETSNGRTITKRRKTKRTVMFEDPRKHKRINTPKARTPRNVVKEIKGRDHQHPSNIGDLFTEGSLNPYTDDPYAFD